ncbi:MAG TPA: hypothetical protein VEI97_14760 [bacterium]|nr:hypothetical protein [bacterium]
MDAVRDLIEAFQRDALLAAASGEDYAPGTYVRGARYGKSAAYQDAAARLADALARDAAKVEAVVAQNLALHRALEEAQAHVARLPLGSAPPHSEELGCPTWDEGCHCTLDTLMKLSQSLVLAWEERDEAEARAEVAEAEVSQLRARLAEVEAERDEARAAACNGTCRDQGSRHVGMALRYPQGTRKAMAYEFLRGWLTSQGGVFWPADAWWDSKPRAIPESTFAEVLREMAEAGEVVRVGRGRYQRARRTQWAMDKVLEAGVWDPGGVTGLDTAHTGDEADPVPDHHDPMRGRRSPIAQRHFNGLLRAAADTLAPGWREAQAAREFGPRTMAPPLLPDGTQLRPESEGAEDPSVRDWEPDPTRPATAPDGSRWTVATAPIGGWWRRSDGYGSPFRITGFSRDCDKGLIELPDGDQLPIERGDASPWPVVIPVRRRES